MDLKEKVAIINGLSSAIGKVISKALLENSVYISGTYHRRKENINDLVRKFDNERVKLFEVDFLTYEYEKKIERIVIETKRCFGKIDILINVSGIWIVKPFLYEEKEEIEQVWRVNYWATYQFIKKTIPHMMNEGGSIINIASTVGIEGAGQQASYGASKAAIINLTKSIAEEFAPRHIRVNVISPGYTDTPALDKYLDNANKELLIKHIPMARFCKPEDVANTVLYLLQNDYITGVNIPLHGGKL
ncbi:MAG: SDR family oxidoreductase [Candidatus Aminicenantes bacterium]|nr:SDR family oxidoreductase [Candidatus Aminicenantes bacterium]